MANQVMRITLKAYDHQLVDASAAKIIETVKKNGAMVSGPVPLPTCLLYTSPSPRDGATSRMPSSA